MTSEMKIDPPPPPLTWEILSQLSSTSTSSNRPFFVQQRQQQQQREEGQTSFMLSATIIENENHTTFIRACPLPATNNYAPTLYSLQDIRMEFLRVLKIHDGGGCADGGRLSSSEMSMWLGMEEEDFITLGDALLCLQQREQQQQTTSGISNCTNDDDDNNNIICKVYNTVKKKYQYALVHSLRHQIEERIKWHISGETTLESAAKPSSCCLSDIIAQEMQLTSEDVTWLSQGIIATTIDTPITDHHHRTLENQVLASLSGVSAPTPLDKLFDKEDLALLIPIVKTLCQQGRLPGNVSSSSSSSNNAVYTPDIFTYFQRNVIDSFFRTNGYITDKKCAGVGLSRNRMESFVRESFPKAMLLNTHSMIDPKVICHPLEGAIQSAVLQDGFADLRSSIPLDIASNNDDVEAVIHGCLVDSLKAQQDNTAMYDAFVKGTALINSDIALFFSHEMSKKSVKMLDPLIESYSKQRAKEIVENQSGIGAGGKKGKSAESSTAAADDIVSLRDVATCIGEFYPDLLRLQQAYEEDSGCDSYSSHCLSWNSEDVGSRCDGPLIEFCRAVVYSAIEHKCIRAVKAEVSSLDSTRHGVSVSEHSVGAAKQMDVQEAFEISFKDICHLLQILTKVIENFSAKGVFTSAEINSMKRELLSGTGSCLTRLLTEYCLYKENAAEGAHALTFVDQDHNSSSSLGTPIDVSAALDFPSFSLQYNNNTAGGGKQKSPLQYLREILPGSSGLSLVRMWKICGGGSSDDDDAQDAGELLDQFIRHLEESCLTLVGIPFSILDKKAEKRMMSLRRQGLIDRLDKSNQQEEILSTCVILIYQQTKSVMICGKTMISLVWNNLFEEEKKIPKSVTDVLWKLKHENDVSPELLDLAKKFGSAKNNKALAAISE